MSGLYLPGVEMPKTGRYFVAVDNTDGKDKRVISIMSEFEREDKTRPLLAVHEAVPVPDHGRLIDADALDDILADQSEDAYNRTHAPRSWERALSVMRDYLNDAPTIIPASGGTENVDS